MTLSNDPIFLTLLQQGSASGIRHGAYSGLAGLAMALSSIIVVDNAMPHRVI